MNKSILIPAMLCGILAQNTIGMADNQPRDYIPAPPGTFGQLFYYHHLSADTLLINGEKVADNLDLTGNVGISRTVYYFEVGGMEAAGNILIPFGDFSFDIPDAGAHLSASGLANPILAGFLWPYRNNESKTWFGLGQYIFFPVGDYENDGALSLADNRWRFREEMNFTKGFEIAKGHNAYFELTIAGDFFTDNDDYGAASAAQSKDPLLTVESHLNYDVTKDFFVSADYYYHNGGETSVGGASQDDAVSNHTVGLTFGFGVAPGYQLLMEYTRDIEVDNGLEAQGILFRFLYACDVNSLFGSPAASK